MTKDPAKAVPGCDIIILAVPAFAHQGYFDALKPYITPGVIVVGLPGNAGFEFAVRGSWGDLAKQCTIMSFESLPWAARIKEFGRCAEVLGTKGTLMGAVRIGDPAPPSDPTAMLQNILGPLPKLTTTGHLLGITLMGLNAYIHPSIMYGRWHNWDGKSMAEAPLFYNGLDEYSADIMSGASDEIIAIAKGIMQQKTDVDLNNVSHIYQWYLRAYSEDIDNKENLYQAIRTNHAYEGLTHPMKSTADGKLVPNFEYRYLTEDIPYGLVVMKGIAEVAQVATPVIDRMILWAQEKMGKEYMVDGKISGKHVPETRSPQRYGLTTLETMLGWGISKQLQLPTFENICHIDSIDIMRTQQS